MKRVGLTLSAAFALATCLPSPAMAFPDLQLYVQGGSYDAGSDTWIVYPSSSPLDLWVIGNVNGPGGKGSITNVNLVASYETSAAPVSLQLTPGTTSGYTDPPTAGSTVNGQINVYSLQLLSAATGPVSLRFYAFGTNSMGKSTFAPYSHDATANGLTTAVPEPATISLLLSACVPLGVAGLHRLRRRVRSGPV